MALDELCTDESVWDRKHPALTNASPETRKTVCDVLLDYMRRGLAIRAECLNPPTMVMLFGEEVSKILLNHGSSIPKSE